MKILLLENIHPDAGAVFAAAGHLPHRDQPWRFVRALLDFVASTEPARMDAAGWRRLIRQ